MVRVFAFASSAFVCLLVGQAVKAIESDTKDYIIDIESEGKALDWRLNECSPGQRWCTLDDIINVDTPQQYMTSDFGGRIKRIRIRPTKNTGSYFEQYTNDDIPPRGFIVICRGGTGKRQSDDVEAKISQGKEGSVIFSCEDQYESDDETDKKEVDFEDKFMNPDESDGGAEEVEVNTMSPVPEDETSLAGHIRRGNRELNYGVQNWGDQKNSSRT